jgi:dipeptidyl aminopeptidase/acylaminoacyl peptidase
MMAREESSRRIVRTEGRQTQSDLRNPMNWKISSKYLHSGLSRVTRFALAIVITAAAVPRVAQSKHPISFEDLMKVQRISDIQVSPDSRWIAYVLTTVDLKANKKTGHLWTAPTQGGSPRQLTRGDGSESHARWSPDGSWLAFVSTRGGKSQIWMIAMIGGEARPLTSISTEAEGVLWSRDGNWVLFTSKVYPDCSDEECNQKRLEEAAKSPVKAQVIDALLFRHWDEYRAGKYMHLFLVPAHGGRPHDLTPGSFDSPTFFLGAPDGYSISPDGSEVCYTSNRTGQPAWTTNNDLYVAPVLGGESKNITQNSPGSDAAPQYSPDGRYIAYTSQARNGYEADLFRLRAYDRRTGSVRELTSGFGQWVNSFVWAPDSDTIYFTAPERGLQPLFKTSVNNPRVERVLDGFNDEPQVTSDGKSLAVIRSSLTQPAEIYLTPSADGSPTVVTHANDGLMAELELRAVESVTAKGAGGTEIHSWLLKPPGFQESKKYPGLLLIHGGPQGAWDDAWSYRWNAQMFAAHGYTVMMPNPRGSTGYGQKFIEEISGDWGGACYRDLMDAAAYLDSLPYVDKGRIGAAGASFGGFMINWIAGHTQRFKVLVSHDGVYDQRSMYGEREELWFPEWEFRGVPWKDPSLYEKWSPSNYVQNIRTPMLVVQGELDLRGPTGQGLQLFCATPGSSLQIALFPRRRSLGLETPKQRALV